MSSNTITVTPCSKIDTVVTVPGDKSISHRSLMVSALSEGTCSISNLLTSEDCLHTLQALRALGVSIIQQGDTKFTVAGSGLQGLKNPSSPLDMGNSGTGMRLLAGLLSSQKVTAVLFGDESLSMRPMKRIITPLTVMGADISARDGNYPPLTIRGKKLNPIEYQLPVASAQVKSAILLAALPLNGETTIIEPSHSRDHTEKMLRYFGADITVDGLSISLMGGKKLTARDIVVPGDISSAAFFMVAAAAMPGAKLVIKDVGLNPTRTGIIKVLHQMGADIVISPSEHDVAKWAEERGDIHIKGTRLSGITIGGDDIPNVIDELPIIAVAGALADGVTVIKDAHELRVKESDRISTMVTNLKKIGVRVEEQSDGMTIGGNSELAGAEVDSYGDHRIAMSMAVAGLFVRNGRITVKDVKNINTSFPNFQPLFQQCFQS
ncbi:MAG: 3-phosphoshikimate 1-carboxyvinyltransferase [Candidatus Auribacter fodinae]|jgi:3-phosphoshikimate 1-carboxyvinyltransferase|uniref:3-phosphoshikimate 1-carboxyvinyltransferase n=1 Tax=Candidatus Auribacter fodinae TaxID=2093366 RepID=A0A3A4RBQ5_9BACT|nr:MAG: 3-phosphoshikimate 1-carboxyvinyltransferase [Candidatus Auribacter fodinae]